MDVGEETRLCIITAHKKFAGKIKFEAIYVAQTQIVYNVQTERKIEFLTFLNLKYVKMFREKIAIKIGI